MTSDPQERGGATGEDHQSVGEWERKANEWRQQCHSVQLQLAAIEGRWKTAEVLKSQLQSDKAALLAQLAERDATIKRLAADSRHYENQASNLSEDLDRAEAQVEAIRRVVAEWAEAWRADPTPPIEREMILYRRLSALVALDQAQRPHHAVDAHTEGTEGTDE